MKKIIFLLICCAGTFTSFAQVKLPAPSPTQTLKQDFGLSSIELSYSRPGVKGREMIGNIEPWGVVWRTGANAATTITFHDDVEVAGNPVPAGTYALYTVPQKDGNWGFILNKGVKNSGVTGYKESEDVLRVKIKATTNADPVETLTMQFSDIRPESVNLNIKWENFALQIPITTNIKDKIRSQLAAALKGEKKPYWQAARFYHEFDSNPEKALEMMNALLAQSDKPAFYFVHYKAKIQQDMGDKKGAMATAKWSLELAKEAGDAHYVLLNEKMIKEMK